MPNKTVSPKEQWNTQIPMMVKPGPKPIIADLSLQCTFEGVRVRNKRDEGVISVKGRVLGRDQYAKSLEGEITGRLAFDLTGGYISQAQLTISSELEGSDYAFIDAFDIVLDRVAGNPDGIPQPKEYKPPPEQKPLVANGPVLVNWKGTLVQKDPLDPAADGTKRQGSRMKVHTVKMEAGKTYVISLNSEQFDSYLRVEDSKKKNLAEDDDGGGFPNARIVFTCRTSGTYSVIVTAYDRKMGAYHLQVQEAGPQK
jgi:hypothetical protein